MPNINFPTSPALNDQYSFQGKTWTYNGVAWVLTLSPTSVRLDSAYGHANAAFAYANTISGGAAIDNVARLQANSSYIHANAAFDKANTSSKSTASNTAPGSPSIGDLWYDTDTDVLLRYTYDGTSNNWVDITGPTIGRSTYVRPTYLITANAS